MATTTWMSCGEGFWTRVVRNCLSFSLVISINFTVLYAGWSGKSLPHDHQHNKKVWASKNSSTFAIQPLAATVSTLDSSLVSRAVSNPLSVVPPLYLGQSVSWKYWFTEMKDFTDVKHVEIPVGEAVTRRKLKCISYLCPPCYIIESLAWNVSVECQPEKACFQPTIIQPSTHNLLQ